MVKIRTTVPSDLSADVLFASDYTCCICRERGKPLQIHHIDGNPINNVFENLSVLCLDCHNRTQQKGGFDRKMDSALVTRYRNDWLGRVTLRRNLADDMAVKRQVGGISLTQQIENQHIPVIPPKQVKEPLLDYINSLPWFKAALLQQAQKKWDTGITSTMVEANYDYIDSLTRSCYACKLLFSSTVW